MSLQDQVSFTIPLNIIKSSNSPISKPMNSPTPTRMCEKITTLNSLIKDPNISAKNVDSSFSIDQVESANKTKLKSSFDLEKCSLEISKIKERHENNKKKYGIK